jgi:5-methylcytosine-specific restriction endonuclease McrA
MCRAMQVCSELGNQPGRWSKTSPLPPPAWFADELDKFALAVETAANGDVDQSRRWLKQVRAAEMRRWYLDHGQNSGTYRNRHFRLPKPTTPCTHSGSPPPGNITAAYKRDHYRCRYCGLKLVPVEVLKAYEIAVGSGSFAAAAKNESHGAALVFRATYDHVDPLTCGGRHDVANLVAACYSCNFGKAGWTVQQLGLDDPRTRPPIPDGWDGMTSLTKKLRAAQLAA